MAKTDDRPYQVASIEGLRQGFRDHHTRQVLAAPTGAGKSVIMLEMIERAREKGSRILFICERRILVEQFSRHLDAQRIDHGIMMAKHWRFKPQELVQIATAQTLEKMESWPAFDICFVDEIHACMRKSIKQMMTNFPKLKVVGATATPFHPELGKYFSSVTSVISMGELVEKAYLVPFRVFVAHEIDTTGIKIVAGEWKKDELEARGQQIVGDVVADYIRISNEVFGRHSKAICFSCGVAHGADLARKFAEAGVNAVQISSNDEDEYRAEVLADFAKPDTSINVLISVSILSRGFDQTDVEHVILARPLKKSFSEHVQMVGRGARSHPDKKFCIASGQRVLTHRGLVAIEEVSLYDTLWDGNSFVSHKGIIYKGIQHVITYQGLTATPDHRVKTKEGWRTLGECSEKQIPIVQTGFGRAPIRESENLFSGRGVERKALAKEDVRPLRVSNLLRKISDLIRQFVSRDSRRLCQMQSAEDSYQQNGSSESCSTRTTVHEPKRYPLPRLWRTWNSIQIRECFGWLFVGHGEFAITTGFEEIPTGSHRQRETLRAWEFAVGNKFCEFVSHTKANAQCAIAFVQVGKSNNSLRRSNVETSIQHGTDERSDHREIPQTVEQTQREVWDILDSGPNNCFTCEGLLVHNCVIQDNSGNWLRFKESWDDFYTNGVSSLNEGPDEKPRKEPSEKDKAAAKCPRCGHLWTSGSDVCSHCGAIRARRNEVNAVAGEMSELTLVAKVEKFSIEYKTDFYAQLIGYCELKGQAPGAAYHRYIEKFGVGPSMLKPAAKEPTPGVLSWIRSRQIAYAKRRKAA